jgi:hypothetical protein
MRLGELQPQSHWALDNGSVTLAIPGYGYSDAAYPTLATARVPRSEMPDPGAKILAAMIWVPTVLIFSAMWAIDQKPLALLFAGLGLVVHSLIRSRIAIYFLVAAIVLEHVLGTSFAAFSISKILGVWAFIVSSPKLMRSLQGSRVKDPIAKWIILFLFMGLLSLSLSSVPMYSAVFFVTMLLVYSLPWLVNVNIVDWGHYKVLMIALILSAGLLACQFIVTGGQEMAAWERAEAQSLVGEASSEVNEVSRLMALGVFSTIFLFFLTKKVLFKLLCIVAGTVLCVGVVITQSRACYIAIPLAVVVGIWLVRRVGMVGRLAVTMSAVVLTIAVFFLGSKTAFMGESIQRRVDSIFDAEDVGGRGIRFMLWKGYTQASLRRGVVVGYGLYSTQADPTARSYGAIGSAHSDYFHILGDLGLIGLIFFLGIHVNLMLRIRRIGPWRQQYVAWMMWLFLIIGGVLETDFMRKVYGLGIAMILVMIRLSEKDVAEHQQDVAQMQYQCAPEQASMQHLPEGESAVGSP